MTFYVQDFRFPYLGYEKIEASSPVMAKIEYCTQKGMIPLLNADQLIVNELCPDDVAS